MQNTEKFYYAGSFDYTIKRTLKDGGKTYTGSHPSVSMDPKKHLPVWHQGCHQLVDWCVAVLKEESGRGFTLTLRQLYYKLVGKNRIPNHTRVYDAMTEVVNKARQAGIISWTSMEDRERSIRVAATYEGIDQALRDTAENYSLDLLQTQDHRVVCMVEKNALLDVIRPVCLRYCVPFSANKGYSSSIHLYNEYRQMVEYIGAGRKATILYLGDHDPSGMDMRNDIKGRLNVMLCTGQRINLATVYHHMLDSISFDRLLAIDKAAQLLDVHARYDNDMGGYVFKNTPGLSGKKPDRSDAVVFPNSQVAAAAAYICHHLFSVVDVALTMDQVRQYSLVPNPAKVSDNRAKAYIERYGQESWELDALDNMVLQEILEESIRQHIDLDRYDSMVRLEARHRGIIEELVDSIDL
jgi:hypothetical protein